MLSACHQPSATFSYYGRFLLLRGAHSFRVKVCCAFFLSVLLERCARIRHYVLRRPSLRNSSTEACPKIKVCKGPAVGYEETGVVNFKIGASFVEKVTFVQGK